MIDERSARSERGASYVEAIVLVGVIALMALAGFRLFGKTVAAKTIAHAHCVAALSDCGASEAPRDDAAQASTAPPPAQASVAGRPGDVGGSSWWGRVARGAFGTGLIRGIQAAGSGAEAESIITGAARIGPTTASRAAGPIGLLVTLLGMRGDNVRHPEPCERAGTCVNRYEHATEEAEKRQGIIGFGGPPVAPLVGDREPPPSAPTAEPRAAR